MRNHNIVAGFSLIELLAVMSIITVLTAIALPTQAKSQTAAREISNNMQLRAIVQGFGAYAKSNNTWYPGLDGNGRAKTTEAWQHEHSGGHPYYPQDHSVTLHGGTLSWLVSNDAVWSYCLCDALFSPESLISPGETSLRIKAARIGSAGDPTHIGDAGGVQGVPNCSYAILKVGRLDKDAGRHHEWRCTANGQAVILSDRGKSKSGANYLSTTSIWSASRRVAARFPNDWMGSVAWNDDHVEFKESALLSNTRYGRIANTNNTDSLFVKGDGNGGKKAYDTYMQFNNNDVNDTGHT